MRRAFVALLAAMAMAVALTVPVSAKEFGHLYAEGELFRTFATPAHVAAGTGTDPIYTIAGSTNPDQLSVARYDPGDGSHGGRSAVYHATWVAGDPSQLITSATQLDGLVAAGDLMVVRNEGADFRCPILPPGA